MCVVPDESVVGDSLNGPWSCQQLEVSDDTACMCPPASASFIIIVSPVECACCCSSAGAWSQAPSARPSWSVAHALWPCTGCSTDLPPLVTACTAPALGTQECTQFVPAPQHSASCFDESSGRVHKLQLPGTTLQDVVCYLILADLWKRYEVQYGIPARAWVLTSAARWVAAAAVHQLHQRAVNSSKSRQQQQATSH